MKALKQTYPDLTCVNLTKTVSVNGINYRNVMIVVCAFFRWLARIW